MMACAPGCFSVLLFGGVSLGRNFAKFQKMRDEGVLAKFAIARLYGHFGSRGLQQNVVLCMHLKCIVITRWWHLRQGVFCGLLFGGVSLRRNFAKSPRFAAKGCAMSALQVHSNQNLIKCAMGKSLLNLPRLYGHFGIRGLQQNVVLCLLFKNILIKRWWHLRQGVFVAYFLEEFPLVATLQNLRKCAMRVSLPNLLQLGFTGTLGAAVEKFPYNPHKLIMHAEWLIMYALFCFRRQ